MARIAIDMDGVMADSTQQYINWYAARYGVKVEKSTLLGKPETTGFPLEGVVRQFLYTPGFFRTKPVIPGSQEVIKALHDKHEVYIVSAAMEFPQSLSEKLAWLEEYFPFISWHNIVFCGYKNIVDADYMIDDHIKNLSAFKGEPLLFTAPHNVNVEGYKRVNTWEEVGELLL
jgi:5'-nucleotidase